MKFNSFVFHRSYYEAIKYLTEEQQLHLYNAMFQYVFDKTKKLNLAEYEKGIFALIQPTIDTSLKKYETKVVNGKKGGAPKGNTNAKNRKKTTENNLKQPKNNLNSTEKQPKNKQDKDKDKDYNIKDYIKENSFSKNKRKTSLKTIDEVLANIANIDLRTNLQEYVRARSALKKPLTTHALELAIESLNKLTTNEQEQIEIIKQSIVKGWLDFFPLTQDKPNKQEFIHNNYTKEQIANAMTTDLDNVEV